MVLTVVVIENGVQALQVPQERDFGAIVAFRHIEVKHFGKHGWVGAENPWDVLHHLLLGHEEPSFGNGWSCEI